MGKKGKLLLGVVAVVLAVGVAASVAVSGMMLAAVQKTNRDIRMLLGQSEDLAQEDDVTIAREYTIRSTQRISDAYLSQDDSKLDDAEKETLQMAADVIDEIIQDDMTDYEKEKAVYDWLARYTQQDQGAFLALPTTQAEADTPHGVLKTRNAVCVGYATTFRLLMQMLEIECMVVHNTDLFHTWNLVHLDDGWYHTDVYSDAGTGGYRSFNLNDQMCAQSHEWNKDFFPAANGVEYNYAYQTRREINDVYEIAEGLKQTLDNEEATAFFALKDGFTEETGQIAEALTSRVSDWVMGEMDGVSMDWNFADVGAGNEKVFCVYMRYPEEEITLSEEAEEKIETVLNEVFGEYEWDEADADSYGFAEEKECLGDAFIAGRNGGFGVG